MRSVLTIVASYFDVVSTWDLVAALIKKFLLFIFIYSIGYLNLSAIWPIAILTVILLNSKWEEEKKDRLEIARAMALGSEKEMIMKFPLKLPDWVKFSEFEKTEWINNILKQTWQQVNEYVHDLITNIFEPELQSRVPGFKFDKVVLGNVPLRVEGVKVYDYNDQDKIVMDMIISYKSDCFVTFQTFKFTGGIKDIQLQGRLRVILTPLLPKEPLIGGIQIYFHELPHVDFDLIKFTQVLEIPGIRNRIKQIIMNFIDSNFLYPEYFSINLASEIHSATFKTEGVLRVHVVEAKNLVNKDVIGKSDPYVVLKVGSIRVETQVIQNCLNPKWDYWHDFETELNSEMKIEVWDKDDGTKDDFLGQATVDISNVAKARQTDMYLGLQGVDRGCIYLRLTWLFLSSDFSDLEAVLKETETLSPNVHSAILMIYLDSLNFSSESEEFLSMSGNSPSLNTYIVLEINGEQKQTDVENGTCPCWNKDFTFLLRDPRMTFLDFRIYDDDSKKVIGEASYKVDQLLNVPQMELNKHTLFCNEPYSNTKIHCSIKLRLLKNEYAEEQKSSNRVLEEGTKSTKPLIKQESSVSNKSNISVSTVMSSETESVASDVNSSFLKDEDTPSLGQIKLSVVYSQQRQRLIVNVIEAHFTQKHPHSVDAYVNIVLQTDKLKTKKKTKTVRNIASKLTFNEKFEFLISSQDLNVSFLTLHLKTESGIFDMKKKFQGQTIIALTRCDNLPEILTDWYNLKSKKDPHMYHLVN